MVLLSHPAIQSSSIQSSSCPLQNNKEFLDKPIRLQQAVPQPQAGEEEGLGAVAEAMMEEAGAIVEGAELQGVAEAEAINKALLEHLVEVVVSEPALHTPKVILRLKGGPDR